MATKEEALEDEYEEYDEYEDEEDEEDEGGLSGLVVLLMGVVMLGAFASVVWIAYQQGTKNGSTPYVAADPEPVKIEAPEQATVAGNDREVYDTIDGGDTNPVEVIAAGPEEPIDRDVDDTIGAIAANVTDAADEAGEIVDDAVADRIAQLESADAALNDLNDNVENAVEDAADSAAQAVEAATEEISVPAPTVPSVAPAVSVPDPTPSASALSGSHLVQVGAFRSQAEADGFWTRMQGKMGGYLDGKSKDVERADLGAKGIYYRLRVGPFASSDAAKTYCVGLKERGQDCLIKKK